MISLVLEKNVTLACRLESSTAGLTSQMGLAVGRNLIAVVQAIQFVITLASVHQMSLMKDSNTLHALQTTTSVLQEPMQKLEQKR